MEHDMTMPDAWFAGYFDADGSIGIAPPRGTSIYLLHVSVVSVIEESVLLFKDHYGGKVIGPLVSRAENRRDTYRWQAETGVAEEALRLMIPWLVVKKDRARLALNFRDLFKGENVLPRGPAVNLYPEKRERILAARKEYYDEMRRLNKRGTTTRA